MRAIELLQTVEDLLNGRVLPALEEANLGFPHTDVYAEVEAWVKKWQQLTAQGEHYDKEAILVRLVKMELSYRMKEPEILDTIEVLGPKSPEKIYELMCATVIGELLNQLSIRLTPEEYTIMVSVEELMAQRAKMAEENARLHSRVQELELMAEAE